jgi:hypothetical protein
MARCINKNLNEFKDVAEALGSSIHANSLIVSWQDFNNSDLIPTITEALEFEKRNKAYYNMKTQEFTNALYSNLVRLKILTKYKGTHYVVSSRNKVFDASIRSFNLRRMRSYLRMNNINEDSITEFSKGKGLAVEINQGMFLPQDIIPQARKANTPHTKEVVRHLMRMFPQLNVRLLSVKDAKLLHDSLPLAQRSKVNFNKVNSFYVDGTAILIKGRITDDIAVEELLHPFIDGVYLDNNVLFNGLLEEAKKSFPELWEGIKDSYNQKRGFSEKHQELELVTQALSRHFNKENNENGTKSFRERVKEFLNWFLDIINDLNKYITGKPLTVDVISPNATLSSIAKLLNTTDIEFKLTTVVDRKVRYNLSEEKQNVYDYAMSKATTPIQKEVVETMFHAAISSSKEVGSLAASTLEDGSPILVLDEPTHTYQDINDITTSWTSATTAINGRMSDEAKSQNQLNLDLGNDFDIILDGLSSNLTKKQIQSKMKVLNDEQSMEAYEVLHEQLSLLTMDGSITIPQVVVYDQTTGIAGTIDLLIIKPNGTLKIVDLKTSKISLTENIYGTGKLSVGAKKYDKSWELNDDSFLVQKGLATKLSTKQKHNLQVNLYRRMLENMGYTVSNENNASTTMHIKVDVKGKGEKQTYKGTFTSEGTIEHKLKDSSMTSGEWQEHQPSQNILYVDSIIPLNIDKSKKQKIDDIASQSPESNFDLNLTEDEAKPDAIDPNNSNREIAFEVVTQTLMDYQLGLVKKQEVLNSMKGKTFLGKHKTASQLEESIVNAISAINIGLAGTPKGRSRIYSSLLLDALKQIKEFQNYVEDPVNFNKPEYISYVLNFDKFIKTFEGLYAIKKSDSLNVTQKSLVLQLQTKANEMIGVGNYNNHTEGVIDKAVMSYVRSIISTTSTREFSEADLDQLFKMGEDIGVVEYQTSGGLANSKDTFLAVMNTIYKNKKQELQDKFQTREAATRRLSQKLQILSGVTDISNKKQLKKMYDFMHVNNANGEFSGRYVQEIGDEYYNMFDELRAPLRDEQGQPYQYREVLDVTTAKPEDIEFNIKLAKAKKIFGNFFRAETIGVNDQPVAGEFHYFTEEFNIARRKHENFVASGEHGFWEKKDGVSLQNWQKYQAKYYLTGIDQEGKTIALKDQKGNYTGQISHDYIFPTVKREYRKIRLDSGGPSNKNMRSKKFIAIQKDKTALGLARKEFYDLFREQYENELLAKLPQAQRSQMLGRVPLIRGRMTRDIKKKGAAFTTMFAKTTRGVKNLFRETSQQRTIFTDEKDNLVDGLPIFYTGIPTTDAQLADIDEKIKTLEQERKEGKIKFESYKEKSRALQGERLKLENKPSLGELNLDMGNALLKFSAMAEHYETMGAVEDTMKAMLQVIEKREYQPAGGKVKTGVKKALGFEAKGIIKGSDSNVLRKAKKWMNMVYYDNENITKGFAEKAADGLIRYSSLSYVAFNPFGNFNNYVLGRVNDNIEAIGGRFYSMKSYNRAVLEYNKRAVPDMIHRLSSIPKKPLWKNDYDPEMPTSKYEAFVDQFRMMDSLNEIRESGSDIDKLGKSYFSRFLDWGYVLQDSAEWNVQTKVGIALLMDTYIKNKDTGEILSLYDAYEFDSETKGNRLKEGFSTIVEINNKNLDKDGKPQLLREVSEYTTDYKYSITNKIREINKQIHGNYSYDDRMIMQSSTIGKLGAQFHKWVAPAIRARVQGEYYDETLGWMEGRYMSWAKFIGYASTEIAKGKINYNKWTEGFLEDHGYIEGGNRQDNQKATNQLYGFYRTMGEIGIIAMSVVIKTLLGAAFEGDDDENETITRLENVLLYQADRTYKELILFTPFGGEQIYQMVKSPIASTRTMGELTEALGMLIETPYHYITQSNEDFYANSSVVYQRGSRAGQLKLKKEIQDGTPVFYSFKKWFNFLDMDDFFVK